MKLVFTDQNRLLVSNIANLLALAGIEVITRNEFASGAAGGLAPTDAWLELWVESEREAVQALAIVEEATRALESGERWVCSQCQEVNESSFEICWRCQHQRETAAP